MSQLISYGSKGLDKIKTYSLSYAILTVATALYILGAILYYYRVNLESYFVKIVILMLVLSKHLPSRNISQSLKEYSFLLQMHASDSAQPIFKKQKNMTINSIV
jgi:hypothetical protein